MPLGVGTSQRQPVYFLLMRRTSVFSAVLVAATALVVAPTASASVPRAFVFTGGSIPKAVTLTNVDANSRLVGALTRSSPVSPRGLGGRPFIDVVVRWAGGIPVQHGRFYPGWKKLPAEIDLPWAGSWPRRLTEDGLALLEAHGIPVRTQTPRDWYQLWWLIVLGLFVSLGATFVAVRVRRRATRRTATQTPATSGPLVVRPRRATHSRVRSMARSSSRRRRRQPL